MGGKWLRGLKKSKTRDLAVKCGVLRVKSDLVQFLALYHTLVIPNEPVVYWVGYSPCRVGPCKVGTISQRPRAVRA